jgi:hypothetical protein
LGDNHSLSLMIRLSSKPGSLERERERERDSENA